MLRRGELEVTHVDASGIQMRRSVYEPSLIFCPRPVDHRFHNAPTDESDFACASLDIDGGATHPLLQALPPIVVVPLAEIPELDRALDLLFVEVDAQRCGSRVVADRIFEVIVIQMLRWMLDHAQDHGMSTGLLNGLADRHLARALTAVHRTPGAEWTLNTMATEAGMSRSAFTARFKEVVGQTPASYVTDWRITLAQARLKAGDSVTRTAIELGYASGPAFSRAFTSRVGHSPRTWLNTQRAKAITTPSSSRTSD